ncbi:MAG: Acetyltransferase (GNAT) domain-containing protein [Nitrosopumilales archaeon]|nr:MAG: Acetyltransferase (GNAT) domain-containing protein [Nitrosopumilales archaeon]
MTNLWIQTQISSIPNEFWYIDYEKGVATKSNQKPQFQSIRKWQGSIESFFDTKGVKATKEDENTVRFEN